MENGALGALLSQCAGSIDKSHKHGCGGFDTGFELRMELGTKEERVGRYLEYLHPAVRR